MKIHRQSTKLDSKNSVFHRAGKNPGKTLVESAFAIFDTLRQGIPNVFPVFSLTLWYTLDWVKFSANSGVSSVKKEKSL
jgi:hypothetical protein